MVRQPPLLKARRPKRRGLLGEPEGSSRPASPSWSSFGGSCQTADAFFAELVSPMWWVRASEWGGRSRGPTSPSSASAGKLPSGVFFCGFSFPLQGQDHDGILLHRVWRVFLLGGLSPATASGGDRNAARDLVARRLDPKARPRRRTPLQQSQEIKILE
jgi:hypothetical protein